MVALIISAWLMTFARWVSHCRYLPVGAAIGGFANPTVFVIAAFEPDFWTKTHWKIYAAISFIITTIGFMGVGIALLTPANRERQP